VSTRKEKDSTYFDVLVAGELNVDLILDDIGKLPEIGKEILADRMTLTLGSSSAIFASNLSTLGSRVTFAGMLGKDRFGDLVADSLNSKGVDTGNLLTSPSAGTGATIVLNYGEDRAMVTYPGAMALLQESDIKDEILQRSRHLHVSSVFLQPALKPGLLELFSRAKDLGLTTSLDTQWDPDEKWDLPLRRLLPLVDVFLPNMQEFLFLTQSVALEEGLRKVAYFANTISVKDGSNGAFLWNQGELLHQEAFLNRDVVDCIGAGDSFDAGFIHHFVQKKSLKKCMEFATLAGAINTTAAGGTTAFKSLEAFREIAAKKFGYKF
jgi:sugar/nucleoside kinase (ribokinase family)